MPIPVNNVLAVFDKLSDQTEKQTYLIEIKDSKTLNDGLQPQSDWEFFISIDPAKMKNAIAIIGGGLNADDAPRVALQLAAKKEVENYPVGKEIRLRFFEPVDLKAALAFLQEVERLLKEAGVEPDAREFPQGEAFGCVSKVEVPYVRYRHTTNFLVLEDDHYKDLKATSPVANDVRGGGKLIQSSYYKQLQAQGKGHCPCAEVDFFSPKPQPGPVLQKPLQTKASPLPKTNQRQEERKKPNPNFQQKKQPTDTHKLPFQTQTKTTITTTATQLNVTPSKTQREQRTAVAQISRKNQSIAVVRIPQQLQKTNPKLQQAVTALGIRINELKQYGELKLICPPERKAVNQEPVKQTTEHKKSHAINTLTQNLSNQLIAFAQNPTAETYKQFSAKFTKTLNDCSETLQEHRDSWKPAAMVFANLLLALTGIGTVILAVNAAYAMTQKEGLTWRSGLFGMRTNSEEKALEVESALEELESRFKPE